MMLHAVWMEIFFDCRDVLKSRESDDSRVFVMVVVVVQVGTWN